MAVGPNAKEKNSDVLPADVQQKLRKDFKIWYTDRQEGRRTPLQKEQKSLLANALYLIGKLAAIPMSLIPGTEEFRQDWYDRSCDTFKEQYRTAVETARSACTTVMNRCEPNEKMRLLGELRLLPGEYRTLVGV